MKIKTQKILIDFDGNQLNFNDKPLTTGVAITTILVSPRQGEKDVLKLYKLAEKFYKSEEEVEINDNELKLIKEFIITNGNFSSVVLGQLIKILK